MQYVPSKTGGPGSLHVQPEIAAATTAPVASSTATTGARSVTSSVTALAASARGVAVMWMGPGGVPASGAVYLAASPEGATESVPHPVPVHPFPERLHRIVVTGSEFAAGNRVDE